MTMHRRLFAVSAIALTTAASHAQSFNVDIDSLAGQPGTGVPPSSYGSAVEQAGFWNSINPSTAITSTLKNLNGTNSAATFTRSTNGTFSGGNLMIFDFALLYNDWQAISPGGGDLVYSFNNLQAGDYLLYTYAHNTGTGGVGVETEVEVVSAGGPDIVQCGGFLSANSFSQFNVSHIVHSKTLAAGGSITVKIRSGGTDPGVVNGFQLVKLPAGSFPVRKYVDKDAAVSFYNGNSWTEPYQYLSDALSFASMVGGSNCEIWVAQGTYYPPQFQTSTNRDAAFVIPSGLKVYGGFAGTETTLAERGDPAFQITNLSGSIGTSAQTDNSYNVVIADATSSSTIIDGFTISRGRASGSSVDNQHVGGGVRILNGSPQFRRCKFISNEASFKGAGVYVSGGVPTFTDCLFFQNNAYNGEGGGFASESPLNQRLVNCEFIGNEAIGNGGGAFFGNGPGELVNCLFSGNHADSTLSYGGAVYADNEAADLIIRNSTFSRNFSNGQYGGVAARNGADINTRNSIYWGNTDNPVNGTALDDQNIFANNLQSSSLTFSFTTVQGLAGAAGANPLFIDADGSDNTIGTTDDDCRLQITSPAIDAGDNNQISTDITDLDQDNNFFEPTPFDLNRVARRVNINSVADTGAGGSPVVDRGAFETPVPPCVGDLNGDGERNTIDLVEFLGDFGTAGPNIPSDLTGDGVVNTLDLTRFLGVFGVPCP
ncbi:MAG: hypothetical protein ACKVZJ_04040 [Phycisphaerales bacterium]